MMLDTADNKIYFPRFYDIDTICSYDNSGQLKFDVDIEMEQGYWNTSSSRLWTRIRDLMHDDIVTTYNNMRQNGVSYENMMKYIYDEQIAKIPQTYYNKDYDIKYAPFADSYIGMAHGDTYEHVKRWLKQRFTFVDTLFDYAPSYNNDILTIRANTTELMTLEIETYTPVYLHLSWYNGQMDKKKIDGKVSVEFSGKAQTATDQEVLIYGGSNVKSIKGIQSTNPNRLIIGSATKLTELDASNCPLLNEINMNKANLSPHEYLNKVNLSNCPLLEGNLRLNNSPLVQEINIKGTNITGMNLPSSIRNLQVLRLPNTMTDLTLNDAGMLHTLEFDEGVNLQSVSMTNCNALENIIGFDLLQTPSITLNNSYNTVAELYFRDTTNLSLSNMSNLERVIFTPNNEYETFEMINVANAPDYKITTFNCPQLSTFMTTAPYRESYNNGEYGDIQPNTTFTANSIDISNTQFTDVKLLCTTDTNTLKLPTTVKNFYCDSSFDLDTDYLEDGEYDVVHGELVEPYTTDYEGEVVRVSNNETSLLMKDICTIPTSYINGTSGEAMYNSAFSLSDFIEVVSGTQITLNFWVCRVSEYDANKSFIKQTSLYNDGTQTLFLDSNCKYIRVHAEPGYFGDINAITCTPLVTYTPNLIPSSADGSLIFSMYAPSNTVAPSSGTWDLKGLEFDNFHTFGMNNDVKGGYTKDVFQELTEDYVGTYGSNYRYGNFNSDDCYIELTWNKYTYSIYNGNSCCSVYIRFMTGNTSYVSWSVPLLDNEIRSVPSGTIAHSYGQKLTSPTKMKVYANAEKFELYIKDELVITLTTSDTDFCYVYTGTAASTSAPVRVNYANQAGNVGFTDVVVYTKTDLPITMPARYDDYNITIKNANISPKTHNTMLYPLLVNEDNPITGTLDYTNYAGKHLSWSFAYTDEEYVNIIQPKDELINSYEYKYNAFYDTEYEFVNALEIAIYTSSASGVLPTFNIEFTYTYDEINNGNGTYTTKVYADSLDNLPTKISFDSKTGLLTVDKLNTSNVTSMSDMFRDCKNLTSLDVSSFNTAKVTKMDYMFQNCSNLTSLDVSVFDTTNVTNMGSIFNGCKKLTSLDVSDFDTTNVTNMDSMFYGCESLTSLDVSGFDTTKVTKMGYMFYGCSNLTTLDVSNFNTANVGNMSYMFYDCKSLTSLDVSSFNTAKVTNMSRIFNGCKNLTSLDVSSFNTAKVTDMNYMFSDCSGLTSLNLSGFDTGRVTNMSSMFKTCSGLIELDSMQNISTNLDLSTTKLDATSLLDVIDNLLTVTTNPTLTLGSTLLAKLTENQIAIAVNKGWTVV